MEKNIKLSFLWHMHQPDYRDSEGVIKMPWVFFHAIKDYYDMPWILSQYPTLKASFNLTPSLIEQLKLYADPLEHDYYLQLWIQHPSQLSEQEREWLIKICKSLNVDTMVKPLARLNELYFKEVFDDEELIDLEVQSLLAWCGKYLRLHHPVIQELLLKGRAYNASDKQALFDALIIFMGEILPLYASLLKKGKISLSTTPYFHPILPLLLDMDNVQKANIHTKTPKNPISFAEDAAEHIARAVRLYKETFGVDPVGFWPAEGAVDAKSVQLYKEAGIKWIATDEEILFKSLGDHHRGNLYRPYTYQGLSMAFRDHGLSDLFGFDYRFKASQRAVEHFISAIEPLALAKDDDTVFIILDGENAWEYYHDNAYPFFTQLYEELIHLPWCQTICMDEILNNHEHELQSLSPGSWIGGDFSTWAGHEEKNRAWELIFQTRRDFDNAPHPISTEEREKIKDHFMVAQSSDWFWWYGDDHFTDYALEFDALFRKHLLSIYNIMKIQPPADLFKPIVDHKSSASFMIKPQAAIYPTIDGRLSSFFEWIGCGVIDEARLFSTMDKARGPVEKIRYGSNDEMVYISFDGDIAMLDKERSSLELIIEELSQSIDIRLNSEKTTSGITLKLDTSFELALPKTLFAKMKSVHLRFEIEQNGKIIQTLPGFGALEVQLNEDYSSSWFI